MKLTTSLVTNWHNSSIQTLYRRPYVNKPLIKVGVSNTEKKFSLLVHQVKTWCNVNQTLFTGTLDHKLPTNTLSTLSQYRKGVDEKGNLILVELVEDLKQQQKITKMKANTARLDTNFLRKEKIYAKLKYSRSPQYDIVSGGLAAILSGFLGFLICEKFGLELLDSGDFYTAFMYGVFLVFSCRPLVRVISGFKRDGTYEQSDNVLSAQPLIRFYTTFITLIMKLFK